MSENAKLSVLGREYELPILVGTEKETGVDISKLRGQSGIITMDEGYMNTGACKSAVTFIDGELGILRYRGYDIEDLAQRSSFLEVAYLLIYGELPSQGQFGEFRNRVTRHTMIHEDLKRLYDGFPKDSHPMAILSSMILTLSGYYNDQLDPLNPRHREISITRLLAKTPTIAAYSYKKSIGQPFVYPRNSLSYIGNFLNMMFSVPAEDYAVDPVIEKALDLLLILHADHEQNCSASTVRLVGSSRANLFAAIASGVCALWGPLHGGANQEVIEMLQHIHNDGGDVNKYLNMAKDKNSTFRLMGFGHRVYKNFDPRAKIIKKTADEVLQKLGVNDPLLEIAMKLEEAALNDEYFVERKLYPNVDFYSGIIYKAMGIPTEMFTVMFALGRMPGWIAQWKEMIEDPTTKIGRPRQIYTGAAHRTYVPLDQRG
ncbi:MAG: citrate synthase [Leptonema illini]|jgi:citrate synthase|uniref:Citrate synthase n=2 Tax=Leptonema illini TaxID=183 RepID=H2CC72_9LEPT|nr:citrate synthase [Leptonema illini]EHQ05301.1 citrate synthase [Leptonema illini DSM 21528]KAB2932244.1 MAG: citrate synthase [Leptonema illini]PKL33274.1 MAG: citrate synthase [Spirochaetae bacterium HGW-Spirochaetae-10]